MYKYAIKIEQEWNDGGEHGYFGDMVLFKTKEEMDSYFKSEVFDFVSERDWAIDHLIDLSEDTDYDDIDYCDNEQIIELINDVCDNGSFEINDGTDRYNINCYELSENKKSFGFRLEF